MHSRDIYSSHIVHSYTKSIFVVHYEILPGFVFRYLEANQA